MQAIKESNGILQPKEKLIETYTCEGCGRFVERKEMVIPMGPRKGEIIIANLGCKCEDIRLVKQALEQGKKNKAKKVQQLFDNNSILNTSLQKANFKNYNPPTTELHHAKSKLMDYANNFDVNESHNLLLVGNYGTGKSHLAVAVTKVLMERGLRCLFLSVPKLLTKIKQTYNTSSKFSESDILDLIESVDLFVLDDLGTEYSNSKSENDSWTHTKIFEVLDNRSGKPTIFTTNLDSVQLQKKLNERNLSRVLDGTEIVKMDGPDYRRKEF
ncbi:DNA replication protein DnaC [Oceanobacillus limi]|uniref:DNA replication protein DnaC n=1 Tax=Oceanobacillus limi TaxID=930131 RepID=A0A1I0GYV1_9BACI|nr:ATP-binding protein [Oceanobacillus limi]SET76597.1 DNA replication protein DnaC [Oceanobacillus limi]